MSEPVWYFAYGSNMQPATFRGRRGIAPLHAVPAHLAGWQLVLDKPPILPVAEAMANIVETAGAEVFGVAYAISDEDLVHIDLTEGVLIENYRRIAVRISSLDAGRRVLDAFTLTSEGAEVHGLPPAYVAWLRSRPAGDETPEGAAARQFIDRALKKEPR
jgi:gamma-glutamyl AIG2-like cyclotransferase